MNHEIITQQTSPVKPVCAPLVLDPLMAKMAEATGTNLIDLLFWHTIRTEDNVVHGLLDTPPSGKAKGGTRN